MLPVLPSPRAVAHWVEDTPDDFRFLFKLPRTITHDRRLRQSEAEVGEALRVLEPLGERASPVSIQLPASFGPEQLPILARFLSGLPAEWQWAVEVRPVAIGPNPVVRFIGQTRADANPEWWAKWVPKIAQWIGEGRTPLVFIHTPDNLVAPELARLFHDQVRTLVPDLRPLPEPETGAAQLRLLGG